MRTLLTIGAVAVVCAAAVTARLELRAGPGVRLQTAEVTRGDITANAVETATVQAVETVQVATQVTGTIKELDADFNSVVRKGQVLARIDPAPLQASIDQAAAAVTRADADAQEASVAVDAAKWQFDRTEALHEKQLVTDSDFEDARVARDTAVADLEAARAHAAQARAAVDQDRVLLSQTVIVSPVGGIVTARNVDVGQTVVSNMQAQTLFTIAADLSKVQLNANIDESDMGRVREGQPVTFTVEAYQARTYQGTVTQLRINPVVDQNVVSYTAIVDVANEDLSLRPGMTANVAIRTATHTNVLRVPTAALLFKPGADVFAQINQPVPNLVSRRATTSGGGRDAGTDSGRELIWVLRNGHMVPVQVALGITDGTVVEVAADGLQPGDKIVTNVLSHS